LRTNPAPNYKLKSTSAMATAKNYSVTFPAGKPDNREREPVSLRLATGDQLVLIDAASQGREWGTVECEFDALP